MRLLAALVVRYILWWKGRKIEELDQKLGHLKEVYKVFPSFDAALEYLDETEKVYQQAKAITTQIREIEEKQIKRAYLEKTKETVRERIRQLKLWEKKGDDILERIAIIKELVTILKEVKHVGIKETIANILGWLGLESPIIKVIPEERIMEGKIWRIIIIEDRWGKPWDDMPLGVRKRYLELKRFFEDAGGRFFYTVSPQQGSKTVIMLPYRTLGEVQK